MHSFKLFLILFTLIAASSALLCYVCIYCEDKSVEGVLSSYYQVPRSDSCADDPDDSLIFELEAGKMRPLMSSDQNNRTKDGDTRASVPHCAKMELKVNSKRMVTRFGINLDSNKNEVCDQVDSSVLGYKVKGEECYCNDKDSCNSGNFMKLNFMTFVSTTLLWCGLF